MLWSAPTESRVPVLEETFPSLYMGKWSVVPQIDTKSRKRPRRIILESCFEWAQNLTKFYRFGEVVLPPHLQSRFTTIREMSLEIYESLGQRVPLRLARHWREGILVEGAD